MNTWKQQEPLAAHTTFKIGGPAEWFVVVHTEEELRAAVTEAHSRGLEIVVLGGGSNMLVADDGLRGLVIKNEITGISAEEKGGHMLVTAGAGVVFDELVAYTVDHGYWGLENLSHIPGSVGATPVQNVGAYGVEVGMIIESVRAYDMRNDTFVVLSAKDCSFGYRDSIFKHAVGKDFVVVSVTFVLSTVPDPQLGYKDLAARFGEGSSQTQQEIREAVIEIRGAKFPDWHTVGTAGSFFKNPVITAKEYERIHTEYPALPGFPQEDGRVKVPLGWILDKVCGVRGMREGSVGTYAGQALVIVNEGGASAADISAFATKIADIVRERTGVAIEWEVTKVG